MTTTLLQLIAHEELTELLKEKFGKTQLDIINELQEKENKIIQQQKKWNTFLNQVKKQALQNEDFTPLQVMEKLKKICDYENILDPNKQTLCQKLETWKTDRDSLANVFDKLNIVKQIPEGGLNNVEIEGILSVFEQSFRGFKYYKTMTVDFVYCDVQKRFSQDNYPSEKLIGQINQYIYDVNENGDFKKHQEFLSSHEFGKLDYDQLELLYDQGFHRFGAIINTDTCQNPGMHWVSVYIDLNNGTIELFNSTNQYTEKTQIIMNFMKFLKKEMEELIKKEVILHTNQYDIQVADNNCGIYSLYYIFARILQISPDDIVTELKKDKKENLMQLFKRIMFG